MERLEIELISTTTFPTKLLPIFVIPDLVVAISQGYIDHFSVMPDGVLCCHSYSNKEYTIDEINIQVINLPFYRSSLYLISTKDNLCKGCAIEYWEHF